MYATATLRGLEPDQLLELAEAHERQAAVLRAAATRRTEEIDMHRATKAHFEKLAGAPALVDQYEREGVDRATAISVTAFRLDVPAATVSTYLRKREKQRKTDRDGEVVRLICEGHSNAEIARRVGVHPGTVARIVQRRLTRRRTSTALRSESVAIKIES